MTIARFQRLVPGSKMTVIMGTGHSTLSRKPVQYRKIVGNFLDSVENKKQ